MTILGSCHQVTHREVAGVYETDGGYSGDGDAQRRTVGESKRWVARWSCHVVVRDFADFLDKCFMLDPDKRITPQDALRHPFLAMNSWVVCWSRVMGGCEVRVSWREVKW